MIGRFEVFTLSLSKILSDWNKIATEELKPYDLKGSYVVYLISLYKNHHGLTAAKLCELCGKDKAEVSRAIASMEKKGMVSRVNTTVNGYRANITLTEKGKNATSALRERIKLAVKKGGEGLSDDQRENFYKALEIIGKNLGEISKEGL